MGTTLESAESPALEEGCGAGQLANPTVWASLVIKDLGLKQAKHPLEKDFIPLYV